MKLCLCAMYQVRESIAENLCSLASVIGREPAISELLPLVKLFFADEQDGTASIEIRRKVLRSVAPLVEALGPEACDVHLMPEVCARLRVRGRCEHLHTGVCHYVLQLRLLREYVGKRELTARANNRC